MIEQVIVMCIFTVTLALGDGTFLYRNPPTIMQLYQAGALNNQDQQQIIQNSGDIYPGTGNFPETRSYIDPGNILGNNNYPGNGNYQGRTSGNPVISIYSAGNNDNIPGNGNNPEGRFISMLIGNRVGKCPPEPQCPVNQSSPLICYWDAICPDNEKCCPDTCLNVGKICKPTP